MPTGCRPASPYRLAMAGAALLACCLMAAGDAAAQRNMIQRPMGHTVLDEAQEHYRFESFVTTSADGARSWRVRIAIPRHATPPSGGYPSFWMLDGNAAVMELDQALLGELARADDPQVLVFIGYDNDLRVDTPARMRDYTFVSDTRETRDGTTMTAGGGADAFLETIERQILPGVTQRIALDPARRSLWGHSLGGLFALHTLYSRTGVFHTYAAASPSLWWRQGAVLAEPEQRFSANNAGRRARLLLSLGSRERVRSETDRHRERSAILPADAAERLAERLGAVPGLSVEFHVFDGLDHGATLRASLLHALHRVGGIPDHSQAPRAARAPDR